MGSYNKRQQIHSLSFAINSAFGLKFDNFSALQSFVTNVSNDTLKSGDVQKLLGSDWDTVWGPVVFSNCQTCGSVVADNTMAVYYSASQNLFVIAIAGTNKLSIFSGVNEDLDVSTMVYWNSNSKDQGQISQATVNGLEILLKMEDSGKTMLEALTSYIQSHTISNPEVAVTGHSLGGALAPALALYMHDYPNNWDPNAGDSTKAAMMSAYPSAGPTIGDSDFVNYYGSFITDTPAIGKIDYESVINKLDIVPKAWEADTMGDMPSTYEDGGDGIPYDDAVATLVINFAIEALKAGGTNNSGGFNGNPYERIGTDAEYSIGFIKDVDNAVQKNLAYVNSTNLPSALSSSFNSFINVERFVAQLMVQHLDNYYAILEIAEFMLHYTAIKDGDEPSSAEVTNPVQTLVKEALTSASA